MLRLLVVSVFLTMPVDKAEGSAMFCGTLNRSGSVKMSATRLGRDSVLQQIIEVVQKAQSSKAPIARLADKIAAWFVPAVVLIAIESADIMLLGAFLNLV